ncbi:MAG: outer membrane protein [Arenicella sp.]|jgi:outer membrane protein
MENNNMLAKISLGINVILIIAVIALFVKMPSAAETADSDGVDSLRTVTIPDDGQLVIGYYNSDSLNTRSDFVIAVQNDIAEASKEAENKMLGEQRRIESWQAGWEAKGPNLLDREIQQYQQEAAKMQQDAAMFEQKLQMDLQMSQEKLMITLYSRLESYSKSFAENNGLDLLFSYQIGGNLSYCSPNLDVTAAFIGHTNAQFNDSGVSLEGSDVIPSE